MKKFKTAGGQAGLGEYRKIASNVRRNIFETVKKHIPYNFWKKRSKIFSKHLDISSRGVSKSCLHYPNMFNIFRKYFQHILKIFSSYFKNIFNIFWKYFQHNLKIFSIYFENIFTLNSKNFAGRSRQNILWMLFDNFLYKILPNFGGNAMVVESFFFPDNGDAKFG